MEHARLAKQPIPVIVQVTPLDGHLLKIELGGGSVLELCMQNRLRTTRCYSLNDPKVFFSATTDGAKIMFGRGAEHELELFAREAAHMALHPPEGGGAILAVRPLQRRRIRLDLKGGSALDLDLGDRCGCLEDGELFDSVTTDGEALVFGSALRMGVDELERLMLTAFWQADQGEDGD